MAVQKLAVDKIGRLQVDPVSGRPQVGLAFFDYSATGEALALGPFKESTAYYTARIEQRIRLVRGGELTAPNIIDTYLVYMTLLKKLPSDDIKARYVQHMDSRDANFLVDDEYNITGIIDWDWAIAMPDYSALQSPLLLLISKSYTAKVCPNQASMKRSLPTFSRNEDAVISLRLRRRN